MQVIPHQTHKPLVTRTPFDQMSNLDQFKQSLDKTKSEVELFQEECKELKIKVRTAVIRVLADFRFNVREKLSTQLILSGGSISSLYHGEKVKDYDFWCRDVLPIHDLAMLIKDEGKDIITDDMGANYAGVFEGTGFIETPNAITLRNRMQFITLSDYERARKSFDYIHCLPFYDILNDQFHISMEQWKSIKNKKLVRQYLTLVPSSHRAAKYRERGWKV